MAGPDLSQMLRSVEKEEGPGTWGATALLGEHPSGSSRFPSKLPTGRAWPGLQLLRVRNIPRMGAAGVSRVAGRGPSCAKVLGLQPASELWMRVKHAELGVPWVWPPNTLSYGAGGCHDQAGGGPSEVRVCSRTHGHLAGVGQPVAPSVPLQLAPLSATGQRSQGPGAIASGRWLTLDSSHFAL